MVIFEGAASFTAWMSRDLCNSTTILLLGSHLAIDTKRYRREVIFEDRLTNLKSGIEGKMNNMGREIGEVKKELSGIQNGMAVQNTNMKILLDRRPKCGPFGLAGTYTMDHKNNETA